MRHVASAYVADLAEETGDTAYLVVPDNDEALCIERIEGIHEVRVVSLLLGGRLPLHCGAAALAILSGMTDEKISSVLLSKGLSKRTENTIGDVDELFQEVRLIRERGYVVRRGDVTEGVGSVGAPVRNHTGDVVAAISLGCILPRFDPVRVPVLVHRVRHAADLASRDLGYSAEQFCDG
jgi:DNA-binding IclR family transcriptional regulator